MDNKEILSILSMDLKRVAMGFHQKSHKTAERFLDESIRYCKKVNTQELLPYMILILKEINSLKNIPASRRAEDALLLSTRIQNYVLYKMNSVK